MAGVTGIFGRLLLTNSERSSSLSSEKWSSLPPPLANLKKRDSIDQGLANPLGAAPERYVFASSKTIKWFLTSHPEGLVNILGHQLVPLSVVHELLTVLYQLANPGKNIPSPYTTKT